MADANRTPYQHDQCTQLFTSTLYIAVIEKMMIDTTALYIAVHYIHRDEQRLQVNGVAVVESPCRHPRIWRG